MQCKFTVSDMTLEETMEALKAMGSEQIRNVMKAHQAPDHHMGVKIGDMKTLVKKIKKDHELSMALFRTGISDAQYMAALIADEKKISREELREWAETATWHMISEYSVPWIAAESPYGLELGREWIDSNNPQIECSGWVCLTCVAALLPDRELPLGFYEECLVRIKNTIHSQNDRVRYCMNNFVIGVGGSIAALNEKAKAIAESIGKVHVNMGGTACKVPDAITYISKIEKAGKLGAKRKMVRC